MAGYVPPISGVDMALVVIVTVGSVGLAMLRSKEPVPEDESAAGPPPASGRDRLRRHYQGKWGDIGEDMSAEPPPPPMRR